ncbi:hypothetical protein TNCV_3606131 [Trichonephila clavipes]|uniref:Uncharacterized protein n=1 Tax=Trichonephila clavipes TaxID=2585209 RepID=A0A8X6RMD1_TRICX|nr:hypothetical protein TNCV_3606131 [Trichonephila clavipes]
MMSVMQDLTSLVFSVCGVTCRRLAVVMESGSKSQSSLTPLIYPFFLILIILQMFCPFATPVGLGSLDLFFFLCRFVGLNSFDLLSLCRPRRSRHIPSLAPWAPMSGYTLYVSRRAVVTGIGGKRKQIVNASLCDDEDPVPKFLPSNQGKV